MAPHRIASREDWLKARKALLDKEKAFTRERDALSAARRDLPWVKIEKDYVFDGPRGKLRLADLFHGRGQLIVYHFMFHPDWDAGCPSCSFWADNYNGIVAHLNQRDANLVAISRAPLAKLDAYKKRMGWSFEWVSSFGTDFNHDFAVSFTKEELAREGKTYNFATMKAFGEEAPGISVFARGEDGAIYHTYSCYARGLDMLNGAYHMLDLCPKGRDEDALPFTMKWVKRHDEYDTVAAE